MVVVVGVVVVVVGVVVVVVGVVVVVAVVVDVVVVEEPVVNKSLNQLLIGISFFFSMARLGYSKLLLSNSVGFDLGLLKIESATFTRFGDTLIALGTSLS